jgi:hypothetical protein
MAPETLLNLSKNNVFKCNFLLLPNIAATPSDETTMKQRGRSPAPKPVRPGESGPSPALRAGGASSKSLTTELLHDLRWDDSGGSESSVTKEDSGLVIEPFVNLTLHLIDFY